MTSDMLRRWFPTINQKLTVDDLTSSPNLAALVEVWRSACETATGPLRIPAKLDPLDLPRALLPYVMLLDFEQNVRPVLRVRLAGTYVCEKYGRELRGHTTDDFFAPEDADHVVASALDVAMKRAPDVARREYISLNGGLWSYVRVILPMSRDGHKVDSFFKALDPVSLTRQGGNVAA